MKLLQWIDKRFPLTTTWKRHLSEYYVPRNLNFFYYFGSLALVILSMQILSGLWLSMFYTPTSSEAFASVEYIMREVKGGWFLRYVHSTGASALFIVIYIHIYRGLLYGSYQKPRELLWLFGMILFLLLLAEAFLGYLLPWGQMSYWAAQVITSLFGALPYIGDSLVTWIRGDYHVANATLQRFFALHVIGIPLLLLLMVFFHLIALHKSGSNNPEGIEITNQLDSENKPLDGIPLYPYYVVKDFFGVVVFFMLFFAVVFFVPQMGGYFLEPDNFTQANPMLTPDHITPVWYMTPFYSILRAIPNKLLGIFSMGFSLFILFLVPWLDKSPVKSIRYKGRLSRIALGVFILSFGILGYLGTVIVTPLRQYIAQICTILYFAFFLLMPFYTRKENCLSVPTRIRQ